MPDEGNTFREPSDLLGQAKIDQQGARYREWFIENYEAVKDMARHVGEIGIDIEKEIRAGEPDDEPVAVEGFTRLEWQMIFRGFQHACNHIVAEKNELERQQREDADNAG